MELIVVGSSSAGNCYALKASDGSILVIEAGCSLASLKKAIDFHVSNIVGILVSHEHGDHASKIADYQKASDAPLFASEGTITALEDNHPKWLGKSENIIRSGDFGWVRFGGFNIMALAMKNSQGEPTHDARQPLGFLISHEEMGKLLFATDTYLMRYRPEGLSHIMIECNYSAEKLDENFKKGLIDPKRRKRTVLSHMSLENCKKTLSRMDLTVCRKVILLHISRDNGDINRFKCEVEQVIGKPVFIALEGEKFNLNKSSF